MNVAISDKLPPDVAALLNGECASKAARLGRVRRGQENEQDTRTYLADCRQVEHLRRIKLPEWQRRLEDLCEFVPDQKDGDYRAMLTTFLNSIARAAVVDSNQFAREAIALSGKTFRQ